MTTFLKYLPHGNTTSNYHLFHERNIRGLFNKFVQRASVCSQKERFPLPSQRQIVSQFCCFLILHLFQNPVAMKTSGSAYITSFTWVLGQNFNKIDGAPTIFARLSSMRLFGIWMRWKRLKRRRQTKLLKSIIEYELKRGFQQWKKR